MLTLTPAYDICPQARSGPDRTQAMLIKGQSRASRLATLLAAAPDFHLKESDAAALIEHQISTIARLWPEVCDQAGLSTSGRALLAGRQFLDGYASEGLEGHRALRDAFAAGRSAIMNGPAT
jgi:serine/threonine-protein kinase HipA